MKMNRYFKIILPACVILSVGVFLLIKSITIEDSDRLYRAEEPSRVNISGEIYENPEAAQEVSMPNSPTEKYILQYSEQNNSVILITKKTDGTEIISEVDSINPYYLTDEDIKALTAGIELTSREDMFILIEDFSS